jgi:hypothetical protein
MHPRRCMFKTHSNRAEISERMSDFIANCTHRIAGAKYDAPTVQHLAAALEKFPRPLIREVQDFWNVRGRSGRICCAFVLSLNFQKFFSFRFQFVSCAPNATCRLDDDGNTRNSLR